MSARSKAEARRQDVPRTRSSAGKSPADQDVVRRFSDLEAFEALPRRWSGRPRGCQNFLRTRTAVP